MPANECVPLRAAGGPITGQATATTGGKRFVKVSAPRVGGGLIGGTSKVTTAGPGYGANTLSTDTKDVIQIAVCAATTDIPIGVCGWDLAVGDIGKVIPRASGHTVPVIAGATITAGQQVQTDANGAAIPLAAGIAVGVALDSAASAADCEILLY